MSVFLFIAAIVLGAPIAKAIGRRIVLDGQPQGKPDPELRRQLQATEQRLAETESRLATLEEKLEFYEKLLAKPKE